MNLRKLPVEYYRIGGWGKSDGIKHLLLNGKKGVDFNTTKDLRIYLAEERLKIAKSNIEVVIPPKRVRVKKIVIPVIPVNPFPSSNTNLPSISFMNKNEEKKEQPLPIHYMKVSPPDMFTAAKNVTDIEEINLEPDKLITFNKDIQVRKTRTKKGKEDLWKEIVNDNTGKTDYIKATNFSLLFSALRKKTTAAKKNIEVKDILYNALDNQYNMNSVLFYIKTNKKLLYQVENNKNNIESMLKYYSLNIS